MQVKYTRLQALHDELDEQHKHTQAHASTLEKQVRDVEERITLLRDQMSTVTNNKEYSALLVEANTLKLSKSKVEEEALTQMEQVDSLHKQLQELTQQVAEQKKLVA
ncbi:MAG: hypothetical protein JKX85_14715, partial [Phycisphaeraceae bacterium]|nr:hypothetical protein [Phycisphaeraceae bacterium]